MKQSVLSLKEKQPDIDFLLSNCPACTKKHFKTHPLNIILDVFDICLLGCTIELSCLYISQEHYFISTCDYEVQINM